jgi:YHS domain-containing protein
LYGVLGMTLNCLDENSANSKVEYYDKIYYFCCWKCNEEFGRKPEKYVNNQEREIDCNAH